MPTMDVGAPQDRHHDARARFGVEVRAEAAVAHALVEDTLDVEPPGVVDAFEDRLERLVAAGAECELGPYGREMSGRSTRK